MADFIEEKHYKGKVIVRFYPESHKYFVSVNGGPFKQKPGVTTLIGIKDKSMALGSWYQQITADFLLKLVDKKVKLDQELALEAAVQNEILKTEASDAGKDAHDWCERFVKNLMGIKGFESVPEMPKEKGTVVGVNAFLSWWDSLKIEPMESEKIVFSLEHDYIGTYDFGAKINSVKSIIDFKTSNGLYNSVRLQTIGYKDAAEEEAGKELFKKRWALRLSKYSEKDYYERENRKVQLKQLIARKKGWQIREYPVKPYQVFEAMCFDEDPKNMAQDRKGFLHAIGLYRWDRDTDFFLTKMNQ